MSQGVPPGGRVHAISSHLQVFLSSASVTLCAHTRQLVVQSTIPLCVLSSVHRVSHPPTIPNAVPGADCVLTL